MADAFPALTKSTTATTGTNNYDVETVPLTGEPYRTLKQAVTDGSLSDGNWIYYHVRDLTVLADASFEIGYGQYTDATNTISRLAANVIDSSAGPNTLVTWPGSGQRDFYVLDHIPQMSSQVAVSNALRISAAGNIGVGLNTPGVDVVGTFDYSTTTRLLEASGGTSGRLIAKGSVDAALDLIDTGGAVDEKWAQLINGGGIVKLYIISDAAGVAVDNVFVVDSTNGKIGLGTASPGSNLDVVGGAVINSGGADNDTQIKGLGDDNLAYFDAGNDRVGIGTNTPGASLDVRGSAIFNEDGGANDFRIEGSGEVNAFFVRGSDGRIGMGTNTPDSDVHLVRSNNVAAIHIEAQSTTDQAAVLLDADRSGADQACGDVIGYWTGNAIGKISFLSGDDTTNKDEGDIAFSTWQGGVEDEKVRITMAGDVGIGTNAPDSELHIKSSGGAITPNSNTLALFQKSDSGDSGAGIQIITDTNRNCHILFGDEADEDIGGIFYSNPADQMFMRVATVVGLRIDSNGVTLGAAARTTAALNIDLATEDLEVIDAGSASATEQDWIEVEVGGVQGYIRVYASK